MCSKIKFLKILLLFYKPMELYHPLSANYILYHIWTYVNVPYLDIVSMSFAGHNLKISLKKLNEEKKLSQIVIVLLLPMASKYLFHFL